MKRAFSLMEVLVSLSLFSLLLGSLFFWYNQMSVGKMKLKESQWPLLEERYCHQRLEKIFSTFDGPFFVSDERFPHLAEGSVVFTFDRGITDEPELSGRVLGRLYLDPQEKRLCLGVWPISGQEPNETYVLLTDVDRFTAEFYYLNSGWKRVWYETELPALMKFHLEHGEETLTFAFDLGRPIRYSRSLL